MMVAQNLPMRYKVNGREFITNNQKEFIMKKIILTLAFALFATTCYAHGHGWRPVVTPPVPVYPDVVVPAHPVQTLSTFVKPRVYYMWTPYYTIQPVRPNHFTFFPRLHTTYQPTIQWSWQPYYTY